MRSREFADDLRTIIEDAVNVAREAATDAWSATRDAANEAWDTTRDACGRWTADWEDDTRGYPADAERRQDDAPTNDASSAGDDFPR
jgi:hypothetical protein